MAQNLADMLGLTKKSKPTKPAADNPFGNLRGAGLRKRDMERVDRKIERQQEAASELDQEIKIGQLESTIMDLSNSTLDSSQIAAVRGVLHEKYGCIIGSAGRGKTTVARTVINGWALAENGCFDEELLFSNLTPDPNDKRFVLPFPDEVAIVSYTGRAVQNIQRALPAYLHSRCMTIHSLLEYAPTEEEYMAVDEETGQEYPDVRRVFRPRRTAMFPLTLRYIFIDEGGMTPKKPLWEELLAALPSSCRIVKLGDIQQLPPVHGRSVLGFAMLAWPTFELQYSHRTADGTRIVDGAEVILSGHVPQRDPEGGVHIVNLPDGSMKAASAVKTIVKKLYEQGRWDPLNDAIIVPTNKHDLGQEQLNRELVVMFNGPRYIDDDKRKGLINPRINIQAGFERRTFSVGDKVMATQNDWDAGIANGMIGVIRSIVMNPAYRGNMDGVGEVHSHHFDDDDDEELDLNDITLDDIVPAHPDTQAEAKRQASHIIEVQFQNKEESVRFNTAGAVNSLNLGYVVTCHKAQGGEFKRVILVCHASAKGMLSREWLYTAWTRTKEELIVLCNQRGIQRAVLNQTIKGSTLREKAEKFNALMKDIDAAPTLPEPITLGLPQQVATVNEAS